MASVISRAAAGEALEMTEPRTREDAVVWIHVRRVLSAEEIAASEESKSLFIFIDPSFEDGAGDAARADDDG